jgi:hypothetical protein
MPFKYDWVISLSFERAKQVMGGVQEPNKDEAKNGWTEESLTIYLAERKMTEIDKIYPKKQQPKRTQSRMKWLQR